MTVLTPARTALAAARPAKALELTGRRVAMCVAGAMLIVDIGAVHGVIRAAAYRAAILPPHSEGVTESTIFHGLPSLWLQRWIPESIGTIPAVELWWSLFYLPTMLAVAVLAAFGWQHFFRLAFVYAVMLATADLHYAIFPTRPPWMDFEVNRMLADQAGAFVGADQNPLASVPSLHAGVPALWAMWFCHHQDPRMRKVGGALAVWTVAMLWAVVYTGEHYAMGALAGIFWAILVYAVVDRLGLAQVAARAAPADAESTARVRLVAVASQPEAGGELATSEEAPDARAA